jgi:serine/threonine-protein kinase
LIDRELGNYVVRKLLGEGGMGAVFAGEHRFLGTKVAIKVLHGTFANNPAVTQRFFQEAKSSLEIGHPNIIRILDFGQNNEGSLYLVMELLEGLSLSQAIQAQGRFAEKEAARLAATMCDALAAAHGKGITHRDLKPDNIFLTSTGEVKILDFGIAKVANASGGGGTKTGALMGTPVYMAPEQCKDAKLVGPHTDIYAMGAIIFEMLTGRPPFVGDLAELLAKHLFETPPRPSSLAEVSPEIEALILQCLEKEPADRPPGMAPLRDRLRALTTVDSTLAPRAPTVMAPPPINTPPPPRGSFPRAPSQPAMAVASRQSQPGAAQAGGSHSGQTLPLTTTMSGSAGESIPSLHPTEPQGRRNTGLLVGAVVAALGLAGGGFVLFNKHPPKEDSPAAAAVVAPPPAPKPSPLVAPAVEKPTPPQPSAPEKAPVADKAQVIVRSDPPGATVSIDGVNVGTTPALVRVPLPTEVRLERSGYQPAKEVLTRAGEVNIKLVAEVAHKSSHRPSASTKPAAAAATPTKPAAPAQEPRGEGLN